MKKLITVILIVCLVAAAAVGFAERPQSGLSADFPQQGPMNEIGDIDLNVPAGQFFNNIRARVFTDVYSWK